MGPTLSLSASPSLSSSLFGSGKWRLGLGPRLRWRPDASGSLDACRKDGLESRSRLRGKPIDGLERVGLRAAYDARQDAVRKSEYANRTNGEGLTQRPDLARTRPGGEVQQAADRESGLIWIDR